MREQIQKRFLSLCLTMFAFMILMEQVVNIMVSADQVVTKKDAIGSASFSGDEIMAQRRAVLAGALGLNVSELVPQREAVPPIFVDRIMFHDSYIICGITDGTGRNEGACGIPSLVGYDSIGGAMLRAGGVRMLFSYDGNYKYVDSPNYERYFWEDWNKSGNIPLSTAFLEASWRIDRQQRPTVMACGSTPSEAASRLDAERDFQSGPVKCGWMAWRWYTTKSLSIGAEGTILSAPSQVNAHQVEVRGNSDAEVDAIAKVIGIDLTDLGLIEVNPFGFKTIITSALRLIVEPDGDYTLFVDKPVPPGAATQVMLSSGDVDSSLIETAKKVVEDLNLNDGKEYDIGLVRYLNENSGSADSPENTPQVSEETVVFDQMINGMRFIDPDAGHIEISFDARTGKIRRIRVTLRSIPASSEETSATSGIRSVEQAREQALQSIAGGGGEVIAGSESVGYQMLGGKATPVYRARLSDRNHPSNIAQQAIIPLLNPK